MRLVQMVLWVAFLFVPTATHAAPRLGLGVGGGVGSGLSALYYREQPRAASTLSAHVLLDVSKGFGVGVETSYSRYGGDLNDSYVSTRSMARVLAVGMLRFSDQGVSPYVQIGAGWASKRFEYKDFRYDSSANIYYSQGLDSQGMPALRLGVGADLGESSGDRLSVDAASYLYVYGASERGYFESERLGSSIIASDFVLSLKYSFGSR